MVRDPVRRRMRMSVLFDSALPAATATDAPYPHQIALTPDAICIASTSDGTLSRLAK